MRKYQDIFMRYEKKYLIDKTQHEDLLKRLEGRMVEDEYGQSTICNIYFDTWDYRLIRNSLEKPVYKEKLRLRSYGIPNSDSTVFVELKKKYKGVVYKRRTDMTLEHAHNYLYNNMPCETPTQITHEIDWFMSYYQKVKPTMYIAYDRVAMYDIEDTQLRVTFDSGILWRTEELDLSYGKWGNELLGDDQVLLEIKISGAMPMWLSAILDELAIYPVSFSKYGKAFLLSLMGQNILERGNSYVK